MICVDPDQLTVVMAAPDAVLLEVRQYALGPTHVRKPWFRRAANLAFTLEYQAGVATERVRRMRYESEGAG